MPTPISAALRRRVALPHPGEDRRVEPLHGELDQRHVAEEAGIEHAGRRPLPGRQQPHAALPHADDCAQCLGKSVGGEAADRGRRAALSMRDLISFRSEKVRAARMSFGAR